ncbi:MAG: LemA family protein [Verrucomicrobiales bacterium]|nr:LemA family protein [Verrucomicrobiales bacterium]
MRATLMLLLGGGAFIGLVLIFIYNSLVAKRNMVRNAFSSIDVNLRKRHDLIPNLVETVKAYASHEKETLTKLIEARQEASRTDLSESERLRAEAKVGPRLQRVVALAESYPDLKSSEHFLNLQRNLTETEAQISAARRAYNAAVYQINNAVESFPSNLIAGAFGFQRHDFFEANGSERGSVNI